MITNADVASYLRALDTLFPIAIQQAQHELTLISAERLTKGMIIVEFDSRGKKHLYSVADVYVNGRGCRGVHVHIKGRGFNWCYAPKAEVLVVT